MTMIPSVLDDDMASRTSAPDWTYAQLVRRIVTGEIPAGTRLTEEQLAAELKVSRTPLRMALSRLENARIITKQRNRAIYVAELRADEIEELAALRERIEGLVARRAAERVAREGMSTQRARVIAGQIDAKGLGSAMDVFTLGEHFHLELIKLSGLRRTRDVLTDIYLGLERYRYMLAEDPLRAKKRVEEHEGILDAIEAGDADAAEALMKQHIVNGLAIYRERLLPVLQMATSR
jgi:DNA-binding GntR family transcriptional regulator